MTRRSEHLIALGRDYINSNPLPGAICAFAGGSVGRGEADEFSDLDLNVYLDRNDRSISRNLEFRGEIIQLHIHRFPSIQEVVSDPWDYRFLREARSVYDPDGRFALFRDEAERFFRSEEGREEMFQTIARTVASRKLWASSCIERQERVSAGMAAMAAWIDAALMYGYFEHGRVATGKPILYIRGLEDVYATIIRSWPIEVHCERREIDRKIQGLMAYRGHLRECADHQGNFVLSGVQDVLLARKAEREIRIADHVSLHELLYAEAYCILLNVSQDAVENHLAALPPAHRQALRRLGFRKIEPDEVRLLCGAADDIVEAAEGAGINIDETRKTGWRQR